MRIRPKNTKVISVLLAGVLFFTSLPFVSAASTPQYADLYIKVHINSKDGRLYTFNPENKDATNEAFTTQYVIKTDLKADTPLSSFQSNRDFAQSLFLKIDGIPATSVGFFPKDVGKDLLLVNATDFKQNDLSQDNSIFLVSPYDGFLHFKVKKPLPTEWSTITLSFPSLTQEGKSIQIDPRDTTIPGIVRGSVPYGFWNENMNGIPPGGIYSETIPIKTILDSPTTQKIVSDLIIIRNDNETMPQIPPDSSVAYNTSTTWTRSELVTFAEKFALRAFHALDWTLKADNYGVDHTSIAKYYNKITNVVNGLLILIILVIAFLWNFSIVIPRSRLRRIMIMYVIVSLVVNFSTPVIKLIIDGSNILQNSFMTTQDTTTNQTRRIEAKDFFDYSQLQYDQIFGSELNDSPQATDYKTYDITGNITTGEDKGIKIGLNANGSLDNVTTTGTGQGSSVDPSSAVSHSNTNSSGTMSGGFSVTGNASSDKLVLNQAQIKIPINRRLEDLIFNVAMLMLTGTGFYLISLLFLFRIVVLWFLIILSPILILLTIMPAMQQYFRYWAGIFVRWIAIGPLFALCLGATVFIWKDIGIPLTSLYSSNIHFDQSGNFAIASPGAISPGLNYTKPMMEYIIGLLMMYIPLLLAFWLTKKLACCPSETSRNVFGIRTRSKNLQPERPEPSSSGSSKEPPAGEVLTNIKLNPAGPMGSGEGLFFTQEEKEEKIRESSLETTPMAIGKEENIDFPKQEVQGQDNAISHADEHSVQTADEEETQKSELGTSRFAESSPYLTEFSTKDLIEKYERLDQEKQTKTKEEDELHLMSEQITLANELKHRAEMGDREAQRMEKPEMDRRGEGEDTGDMGADSILGGNQKGRYQQDQFADGSLSRKTPEISAEQEYALAQEEIRGLKSGEDRTHQEEAAEEIIEQTKTTKKTKEEMMAMDSEWEEQEKIPAENKKDEQHTKREKSLDVPQKEKDKKKEETVDEDDPSGKKENPSVQKKDNRIA